MGSPISDFVVRDDLTLDEIGDYGESDSKTAAVDAYTWMYQFLHKIRDYESGEPLTDSEGRITSHLSGLYYRTTNLLEAGIRPVFVFEGGYPELKEEEIQSRRESRDRAQREYEVAREVGDSDRMESLEIRRRGVSDEMVQTAVDLIDALGCPSIVPPSEADAQCARMCREGDVDFVISSDYDTLLFGSPNLLQNLSSDGGELISLSRSMEENDLSYTEFVWTGILLGNDYNDSPYGVGPQTTREWVSECDSFGELLDRAEDKDSDIDRERMRATYRLYTQPPVDLDLEWDDWTRPSEDRVREILVDRHEFSEGRVLSSLESIETRQSGLDEF